MMDSCEICFDKVSFTYDGRKVVEDFTLGIGAGEHVCIMGESGAGKSTLLNSVVGLVTPSGGEIKVSGLPVNVANIQIIRSGTAWLPQDLDFPYQTAMEALLAPYGLKANRNLHFNRENCLSLFGKIGLDASVIDKELKSISGGERQRLMLVSALLLRKKILLMDEPTSALDGVTRDKFASFLKTLTDTTILAITHDEQFAATFDRTLTLNKI